ncbi:hypothetical protein [Sphingomonas sp.]|uniref:hypothetical protein n=1 Tax=Sphingomonas sp. TaxID=28214 RepID=UPI0038A58453
MSDSQQPADDAAPFDLESLDDEIKALLDFPAVPRARIVEGSWTPALQREFVARLAIHGSIQQACDEMGKDRTGHTRLGKHKEAEGFRDACDKAIALARRRLAAQAPAEPLVVPGSRLPPIDYRRKNPAAPPGGLPGQVLNEHGEWEDEDSYARRAEEARDGISVKLLRARRLYLRDISGCAGKRAAFEILTELPVDWEKAQAMRPQADEPWRKPRARETDMLLTAEAGWLGEFTHGPDKKAELLAEVNAWRAERGMALVCWRGEGGGEEEELDDHD